MKKTLAELGPRIGPLLHQAISALATGNTAPAPSGVACDTAPFNATEPVLPMSLSVSRIAPTRGENWTHYKERVANTLGPVREWLRSNAGLECEPLMCGNALRARAMTRQVREAARNDHVRLVELDPPRLVTAMDDAARDIELPSFRSRHPTLDGAGIRVAVLDTGIDTLHPWLTVSDSISTCGEGVDIPGRHGTHVAGSIASRDTVYAGVAPGVALLNIKVVTTNGVAQPSFITQGVDEALERGAHILTMSLGLNHLPTWSNGGHGWICAAGMCQLCTAVNHAVALGVIVVAAAGNDRERAMRLRVNGRGDVIDSEISCPGTADGAITVGALSKRTFRTSSSSSRGPTAFGRAKPDIAGPGVNITSSVPARRGASGAVVPGLTRAQLSGRESGTSMATAIVAGAIALILERRLASGDCARPESVRAELLSSGFRHVARPPFEVGVGRLSVGTL